MPGGEYLSRDKRKVVYPPSTRSSDYVYGDKAPDVLAETGCAQNDRHDRNNLDCGLFVTEKCYDLSSDQSPQTLERQSSVSSEPSSYTPAEQNSSAKAAHDKLDRTSSSGGNGIFGPSSSLLLRQSSGGSCTDSILSSDFPGPSPNQSLNIPSDSTFLNSLYAAEVTKQDGGDGGGESGRSNDAPKSWAQQTEQSYNLQKALALRMMTQAELTDEPRLLGSHFKDGQTSLCSAARSSVEATAHRYWVNGSLGYNDKVQDGFYQVWGMNPHVWDMCNQSDESGHMPSLESLRAVDPADVTFEVVLVDKNGDAHLRELEDKALSLASGLADPRHLAGQLGKCVSMLMGGAAPIEHGDLMDRWQSSSQYLKDCLRSVVIPIGSLSVGLCRHRALLFKALADNIRLPCRVARGCKFCSLDDGASCLVLCGTDKEYLVNLISEPGALCEPDTYLTSPMAHLISSPLRFLDQNPVPAADNEKYSSRTSAVALGSSESIHMDSQFEDVARKKAAERTRQWLQPIQTPPQTGSAAELSISSSGEQTWQSILRSPFATPATLASSDDLNAKDSQSNDVEGDNSQSMVENKVLATDRATKFVSQNRGLAMKEYVRPSRIDEHELAKDVTFSSGFERKGIGGRAQSPLLEPNSLDSGKVFSGGVDGEGRLKEQLIETGGNLSKVRILQRALPSDDWEFPWEEHRVNQWLVARPVYTAEGTEDHLDSGSNTLTQSSKGSTEPVAIEEEWEIHWEDIILGERIGAGSFGIVHRADWMDSDVAVKIIMEQEVPDEQLREFMREIAIMKRLRHPNVVLFMGAVTHPNLAIVTEYLAKGSLFNLLHRSGARKVLDIRRRIRMALDVAKGMNYLHRSNPPIVHRDLKSPNLLVDKAWTVKVCDFGLSRLKGNTFLSSRSGAGTPEWMAPEVLRDEPCNEKADIYSFGVVLWELITLQKPWIGLSPVQVVGAVGFQNRRLQIPKDLNSELAVMIESCWSNDVRLRPSFADVMEQLKPLLKLPEIKLTQNHL